jgi:D-galactarolactone cycloisomerase
MAPAGDPYADSVRDAEATLKRGYRALKPRIGLEPRRDANMVAAIRAAGGRDLTLMVDFNQGFTPRAAIDTARRMEGLDLFWLEEPAGGDDIAGYALVGTQVKAMIAGGEAWGSAAAFREFLAAGAVDIVQPDLSVAGGFTGLKAISALAEAFDRPLTPHVWGTGIGLYAALQLAAALPPRQGGGPGPFPWIEVDQADYPLATLWGRPDPGADGCIAVPDGPGLGIDPKVGDFEDWIVDSWTLS